MRKLKILFASLLLLFIISSCDESIKKVDNPEKATTIEILEHLPQDSVVIAKSEEVFYVINKENLVEYKLYGISQGDTGLLVVFILGIFIGVMFSLLFIAAID